MARILGYSVDPETDLTAYELFKILEAERLYATGAGFQLTGYEVESLPKECGRHICLDEPITYTSPYEGLPFWRRFLMFFSII